jgi:hypothetical protein
VDSASRVKQVEFAGVNHRQELPNRPPVIASAPIFSSDPVKPNDVVLLLGPSKPQSKLLIEMTNSAKAWEQFEPQRMLSSPRFQVSGSSPFLFRESIGGRVKFLPNRFR